jgi:Terminase large subunit, T4likevirus-type, N-terminal
MLEMSKGTTVKIGFSPQEGPQTAYVHSPCDITVYGGSRGGGKTYATLGDFWIHAERYKQYAIGLIIRKTREDLKDVISTARIMYGSAAVYNEKSNYFKFKNEARLYCAYLENEDDAAHYQGWSLTRIYIEELTQFISSDPITRLLATLRSSTGVPCRMKCTCNPGGPGHHWVKSMFIDNGGYNTVEHEDTGLTKVFIPAKLTDNVALMQADPGYVNKLRAVGSPQLVEAWLDGNWDIVEGAFFPEFSKKRHVIRPFRIPPEWVRFRAADWGSAKPFSIGWYAVCQETFTHNDQIIPRGALIRYREWYGCQPNKVNSGLRMPAEEVARGIVERETNGGKREKISYGVLDPAAFAVISGPSIGETLIRNKAPFRRADNARQTHGKRMGGWDQVRSRLKGDDEGNPMLFLFDTGTHLIRTLPIMQNDSYNPEDMDTDLEDHAVDELRYACMSRPHIARIEKGENRNPWLISNAFKLNEL